MVIMEAHIIMQNTLIALELNIFKKKMRNEQETKILSQIFIEYKHTKQYSVNTFVLDLFVLC